MPEPCAHMAEAARAAGTAGVAASGDGCAECLATGGRWVGLRMCLGCGHVGCCDSSPGRHASAHFSETGHPVMQSFGPGQAWRWCYVDEVTG